MMVGCAKAVWRQCKGTGQTATGGAYSISICKLHRNNYFERTELSRTNRYWRLPRLEVLIGVATLNEFACDSSHKANDDFQYSNKAKC
jgi:hypothetical protein